MKLALLMGWLFSYKNLFANNLLVKYLELFDIIIFEILIHIQGVYYAETIL